jgi:lipid-binding SYLF domain-containing protein
LTPPSAPVLLALHQRNLTMSRILPVIVLLLSALLPIGCGASTMSQRLLDASHSLAQVNTLPQKPTKQQMSAAKGVAILSIAQGGVGIGGEGGGGIVLKRVGDGWGAPYAVDAAAGTIGAQLGGQGKDVLVVFNSEAALTDFVKGGMQLQAVAEGTGGSEGGNTRSKSAEREIFVKGTGLFGGAELGGMNFSPANKINAGSYGPAATSTEILDGKVKKPDGTSSLTAALDAMR